MRWLQRLRLPTLCALCRTWGEGALCPACSAAYARLTPRCPQCALLLAPGLLRCVRCTEAGPGALALCLARVDYAWPWVDVVAQFKFQSQPAWASALAALMLQDPAARALLQEADGLLPVPLSAQRQAGRGYNQAHELALGLRAALAHAVAEAPQEGQPVAPQQAPSAWPSASLPESRPKGRGLSPLRERQLALLPDALLHRPSARLQHQLDRAQRAAHARRAYTLNPKRRAALAQRHWVLIDDVLTTGATLEACAQQVLAAGASRVSALVFARTPAPAHAGYDASAAALPDADE